MEEIPVRFKCPLKKSKIPNKKNDEPSDDQEVIYSSDEEDLFLERTENINLRDFNVDELDESSKYVQISNPDGTTKIVLKSSLIWLLSDSPGKLSNDRLKRVQTTPLQKTTKRQKTHTNIPVRNVSENEEIFIGDWCVFQFDPNLMPFIELPQENVIENKLIGSVLGFKYIDGQTEKAKQFHCDSAILIYDKTKRICDDLNVLSTWYFIGDNDSLISLDVKSNFHLNIKDYKCTTPTPIMQENLLTV